MNCVSFYNVEIPDPDANKHPLIGRNLNLCPQCGRPLSHADRQDDWCRSCQKYKKAAVEKYIKTVGGSR
jgi:hypothetical protein